MSRKWTPPKETEVCGIRVRVEIVPLDGNAGECDPDRMAIQIDPAYAKDRETFRRTLLHEVAHMCLHMAGLSANTSGVLSEQVEEQVVTVIENLIEPVAVRLRRI